MEGLGYLVMCYKSYLPGCLSQWWKGGGRRVTFKEGLCQTWWIATLKQYTGIMQPCLPIPRVTLICFRAILSSAFIVLVGILSITSNPYNKSIGMQTLSHIWKARVIPPTTEALLSSITVLASYIVLLARPILLATVQAADSATVFARWPGGSKTYLGSM